MNEQSAQPAQTLDAVRERIDQIDSELLRLLDERADLARAVAAAKQASGQGGQFGLRPAREAQIVRKLIDAPRKSASAALVVRVWRELMADRLSRQGPFHLTVWGGARAVELARLRFGAAPPLRIAGRPEEAVAAAKTQGGVGVLALTGESAWWGRLLAEPRLRVFAALPCLAAWGPQAALAVAEVEVEPSGGDETFWVTDAGGHADTVIEALSRQEVAARLVCEAGGLRLFALAGFYQRDDARLARAPGRLSGVIGAAPGPFDV